MLGGKKSATGHEREETIHYEVIIYTKYTIIN